MYLLTLFIIIEQLLKCDLIKNQFVIILRQPNDNLRFKRHDQLLRFKTVILQPINKNNLYVL